MLKPQGLIFHVEGNLAAGKSTLITKINKHFKHSVVSAYREPDESWKASELLQEFYDRPKTRALSFQSFLAATFLIRDIHVRDTPRKVCILERSLLSASKVFLPLLLDCQFVTLQEFLFLQELNNTYIEKSLKPHFHIYLNTDVDTCYNRIKNRQTPGEESVDYQYLAKIDSLHRSWFKQVDSGKVIEISSTQQDFDKLITRIENYITQSDT